jgi:poly-gamma-glutamate synthesis protein (capsule biosynthesis protein)
LDPITLFLCGDVMAGRGIDQILPRPSRPHLREPYVKSALDYVALAEKVNGRIPRPADSAYIWGDALAEFDRRRPDVRIINLESSITTSEDLQPKGINYRMHPANVSCLTAAGIDCCMLANNHVMDWGRHGLLETLATLRTAGIQRVGAGRDAGEAEAPAILTVSGKGRALVFALGAESSGVPPAWAAGPETPGVWFLPDLTPGMVDRIAASVRTHRQPHDVVVVSIHWGSNWGYEIPASHTAFARRLIDAAAADVVFGHSSHHPRAVEVYKGRPILYGCGDFLNDYEGIEGHRAFRSELVLMYFVTIRSGSGELDRLEMTPLRIKKFRLNRTSAEEAEWMRRALDSECRKLGTSIERTADAGLRLLWV